MGLSDNIRNLSGVVTVEIEGFFTERFINLCRINNVKMWDIRNVVKGIVRFKISVSDFKKLRKIARKRKFAFFLLFMVIFFSIAFSTFVWHINVEGNNEIAKETVIESLKESGLYVGKCKLWLDKKEIINNLRVNLQDITWAGLDIDGTAVTVKIVEKTKLKDKDIQNNKNGDIIANKSGVITRLVPENGTAMLNEGSYVEKGSVLIEGKIYSKILDTKSVPAKGIVKIDCEYENKMEYKYIDILKEYTGKTKYTVGITINSKENMLNYLNKSLKYDITKSSKKLNIFGLQISFDFYTCVEYNEKQVMRSKEELINLSKEDAQNYLNTDILPNTINGNLKDMNISYSDTNDGIIANTKYVVNEEIGEFVEREEVIVNEVKE